MYACVLLAAIVQQSRGYLNPFFFFFDWAAAAGLGSALSAFLLFGPARRLFCSDALLIPAFGSYSSIMQQQPPTEIFAS
jgi:hypothetical protein